MTPENATPAHWALGRLSWDAVPMAHEPIVLWTFIAVVLGGIAVMALITKFRLWGTLWRDWICSIDHKKIGIMYMILGLVMLLRGFADAVMMRLQQAMAFGDNMGYLPPHHYDQIFTAHGVIMIFFVAMPFVTGFMNYVVPLQLGARDVAFPFLNNFSFWMTTSGAVLVMMSLFVGEFSTSGWLALSNLGAQNPGVGLDYYIWALQLAGVGTTLSGINLIVTIIKMRAPGMSLMKMPVFVWTSLCTNALIVASFPVLTAALVLMSMDRYLGTHFFSNDFGGNAMFCTSLYVVQRTCRARLFGGEDMGWFLFWGYQFFIVMAALGLVMMAVFGHIRFALFKRLNNSVNAQDWAAAGKALGQIRPLVALNLALKHLVKMNVLKSVPLVGQVAAVSCGLHNGVPVLDLDYPEDSDCDTDMNLVMNDGGGFIELQGTAEGHAFRRDELDALLALGEKGMTELFAAQRAALAG